MNQTNIKLSEDESSPSMSTTTSNAKNFSRTPTSWDAQDDILLMHLKDQQKLGWKEIASNFTNRTPNACQFRWRRLKSGNLKNPPKSSSGLASPASGSKVPNNSGMKKNKKGTNAKSMSPGNDSPSAFSSYSPITTATFTGYDNSINSALAGLNALSNTPSNISSPMANYHVSSNTNSSTPGLNSPDGGSQTHSLSHNHFDNSPRSEVSLDPQSHHGAATSSGGGYYADISIDPTMNLPHNQAHPHTPGHLTPRNSTSQGSQSSTNRTHTQHSHPAPHNIHNNSIIQIVKDDRTSVSSSTRASVSSLPSKSMNIPHHQLNNSALAHLPILFGGGSSISGPSRNASVSGIPSGYQTTTVSSIRNGSVGSLGYYSRSGSVVIPYTGDKKDDESIKVELKKNDSPATVKKTPKKISQNSKNVSKSSTPNAQTIFKIPWSMEEDELLINRRNRELSFAELSILLPQRTEGEIWSRIDYLEKLRNGHRSSTPREHRRGRQSSIGLDDDDDFYDEVDDVIDGIDVSDDDDDEDDDVLVDDDESVHHAARKRKKRRTSSAVNPLAVGDSIRRKLK